ncbi:MAG TPA: hypothetical protein VJ851_18895 [Jatrophihabitans sp.]|nr:hypothetical protein [Jatrophihabitans sp.]
MRKILTALAITATATAAGGFAAGSAAAAGESLGCFIGPSRYPPSYPNQCVNSSMPSPTGTYSVTFQVVNPRSPETYAWSVPSTLISSETGGCTATTNYCSLANLRPTKVITVSVTATSNGVPVTMSSTADIEPWCGNQFCG